VVADNTDLARSPGTTQWLGWEELADREQANHRIQGVCYFDTTRLDPHLLAGLSAVHPVMNVGTWAPGFQLYYDGNMRTLVGEVDHFNATDLAVCLASSVVSGDRHLDVSGLEFIDHHGLMALSRSLPEGTSLVLHGARPVHARLIDVLGLASARVRLSSSPRTTHGPWAGSPTS